jgi:hypothetical protein
VLDCAGAVVTATVSESVYNKLWIGLSAELPKDSIGSLPEACAKFVVTIRDG